MPESQIQSQDRHANYEHAEGRLSHGVLVEGNSGMKLLHTKGYTEVGNMPTIRKTDTQLNTNLNAGSVLIDCPSYGEEVDCIAGSQKVTNTLDTTKSTALDTTKTLHNRGKDLDYSSEQLDRMDFHQLDNEDFHFDPQSLRLTLLAGVTNSTLLQTLDVLVKIDDDTRGSQQRAFLASLSLEEYNLCGDIIIEGFGDIIKKLKIARQERRKAAREIEEDIARREKRVREKIDRFDRDFVRLKQGGEDVVRKGPAS